MDITYEQVRSMVYEAELDFENSPDELIRTDYSGRYMYGRDCLGLVVNDERDIAKFLYFLGQEAARPEDERRVEGDIDHESFLDFSFDSMGRSTIYYWSHIAVTDVPEERAS